MTVTDQFTFEDLLKLILKSPAMKSLPEEEMKAVVSRSRDVNSQKARQLFEALMWEQEEYKKITHEYIRTTDRIMADFKNDVTDMKTRTLHEEREKAEKMAVEKEQEAAQAILKSIQ